MFCVCLSTQWSIAMFVLSMLLHVPGCEICIFRYFHTSNDTRIIFYSRTLCLFTVLASVRVVRCYKSVRYTHTSMASRSCSCCICVSVPVIDFLMRCEGGANMIVTQNQENLYINSRATSSKGTGRSSFAKVASEAGNISKLHSFPSSTAGNFIYIHTQRKTNSTWI